jgi:hypothetical protein
MITRMGLAGRQYLSKEHDSCTHLRGASTGEEKM